MKFIIAVAAVAGLSIWLAFSLPAAILQFIGALTLVVVGVGVAAFGVVALLAKAMAS